MIPSDRPPLPDGRGVFRPEALAAPAAACAPTPDAAARFRGRGGVGLLFSGLLALLMLTLAGCSTDGRRDTFDYLRSPFNVRMDPVAADHPFCFDAARRMGLSEAACRSASKYRLKWDRPEDTIGFAEYRVYLDTTPPGATGSWAEVRRQRAFASYVMEGAAASSDSIIFILADSGAVPRTIDRAANGLVPLDTTGRIDDLGRLVFAVVTGYRNGGTDGLPGYISVITTDRFGPFPLSVSYAPQATALTVEWDRPRDPTSFFAPGADSGIIRAYYLRIVRAGILNANRPGDFRNVALTYRIGGVDRTAEVAKDTFTTSRGGAPGLLFRLPDSMRVQSRSVGSPLDSIRVTLTGFTAQDTLDISVWAIDSAGNVSKAGTDSSTRTRVLLTDTTQPVRPELTLQAATRNSFAYSFTASRDRVPSAGGLVPAPTPNANILEYRISRRLIAGSGGGLTDRDTIIQIPDNLRNATVFTDTARYLPPGATYRLVIRAVDSTGHQSLPDTLVVSTPATPFPAPDSGATCPPGFTAIPGGRFLLGDTSAAAENDERPGSWRRAPAYCIETLEHRKSSGAFVTSVTWQQAHDICRDLSASLTPSDSTWLCTEAEWERACEGAQPDLPLVYGIQSERRNPGEVRYTCNIGTGDSAMALSAALRDPSCISYDGVLDMSGNLSEWVLDPFTNVYPATTDTVLKRGVPHTPVTASSIRGFRGNTYLTPAAGVSPATQLARSRCSNRTYATQSRPRPYAGCVADGPRLVVTYNSTSKAPRCLPLPEGITAAQIDTIVPARDSSKVLILRKGISEPYVHTLPFDSNYAAAGLKPLNAGLMTQTLAIVTFRNSETAQEIIDTLHASELLNASPANQEAVFRREAATPWSVVKSGGAYQITYRYAYIQTRNAVAKAYYSNAAMGFRCCSKPRP